MTFASGAVRYAPEYFDVADTETAKARILNPEQGLSPNRRWEVETDWLMERMAFPPEAKVVDYGCGLGRLSKRIPNAVTGVDISASMRRMAVEYVGRENFRAVSPLEFQLLIARGERWEGLIACWILQHIPSLERVLDLLRDAMSPGATLWVCNRDTRSLPVKDGDNYGWVADQKSVDGELAARFQFVSAEAVPDSLCAPGAFLKRWTRD